MNTDNNTPIWTVSKPYSCDENTTLQPDAVLASQLRERTNLFYQSEWLLLWAILSDALHVLVSFHPSRPGRSAKEKRQWEADVDWFQATSERPMSFFYICDHLGLDREAVRRHVERLIANPDTSTQLPFAKRPFELSDQAA